MPCFCAPLRSHTHCLTEFSLQVIDLTQSWPDAATEQITHTDFLATVAAVNIFVKLRFTPEQRYPHRLPQQLEAFGALLQQLGYDLAILTPTEWMEICQLRRTLRQHSQSRTVHWEREETVTVAIAFVAYQFATVHIDSVPRSLTSEAGQVSMAAWSVTDLVYCWLRKMGE